MIFSGLVSALRTLTRFSVPGKDCKNQNSLLFWFPLVGAILGLFSFAIALIPFPPMVCASLIVALQAYLTRGFHLDGLCDMADGFGGGWDKERTLSIMKDSHVGSFAVIALVCTLLVQVFSIGAILPFYPILFFAPMLGRFMQVIACATCSYAREEGGTAQALVQTSKKRDAVAPALQILLVLSLLGILDSPSFYPAVGSLVLSCLMFLVLRHLSLKRLGGITGDVLGAIEVLCETSAYLGASVPLAILVLVG
ncbi:adenosylcobinamide-GDP ribazoletransferase [uncultured Sphaerochaeta sp.]|uniref:adenosylcobinamide-GDP ribazoletransferase n=1 Tax=uncultured Sphaerochaeta sp. TaxID=886478 RepID=UPI002A0A678E|nr:adenosylcobinamide-GDP ribazoletransferase [uncultured Sphaerochaeta sp.]